MHAQRAHWDVNFYTHSTPLVLVGSRREQISQKSLQTRSSGVWQCICDPAGGYHCSEIHNASILWSSPHIHRQHVSLYHGNSNKRLTKLQHKSLTLWNPQTWNQVSLNFPNQTASQLLTWFTLYVWGGHCFKHLFSKTTSRHTRQFSGPGPVQPPRQNSWQHCPSDMQLLLPQLSGQTATSFE